MTTYASQEDCDMAKEKNPVEESKKKLMRFFLEVNGDGSPRIVLQPADKGSHPANYVPLHGVELEISEDRDFTEDDAWAVSGRVSDLCRMGYESESRIGNRAGVCEHLSYAYNILVDYLRETDGDWLMSKETSETLIRGAIERIVNAGKCIGFDLDYYRGDKNGE